MTDDLTWHRIDASCYQLSDGSALLTKEGERWVLTADNKTITLPSKASFPHAEVELFRLRGQLGRVLP